LPSCLLDNSSTFFPYLWTYLPSSSPSRVSSVE
jgi:hypothetical protein